MVDIVAPNKGKQLNQTPSPLNAFKRAESLELSKWYMGTLMTNLAETEDTNGAFLLVQEPYYLAPNRLRTSIPVRTSSSTFSKENSTCTSERTFSQWKQENACFSLD